MRWPIYLKFFNFNYRLLEKSSNYSVINAENSGLRLKMLDLSLDTGRASLSFHIKYPETNVTLWKKRKSYSLCFSSSVIYVDKLVLHLKFTSVQSCFFCLLRLWGIFTTSEFLGYITKILSGFKETKIFKSSRGKAKVFTTFFISTNVRNKLLFSFI